MTDEQLIKSHQDLVAEHYCDGTGCQNQAVEMAWETVEVPNWRRPEHACPGERCFEAVRAVYFCEAHRHHAIKEELAA
jgi:hypothetical protein